MLIEHGLDAFDIHKDGHPPMMRACWGQEPRHTETVAVFIEHGATKKALKECAGATRNQGTKRLIEMEMKDEV